MLNLSPITLTNIQLNIIAGFGELKTEHWNKYPTHLKKAIRTKLASKQNMECVYCGCRVYGTGDVEHIAHKGCYPQFLFTPKNLAYSCKMCNEEIKGQKNTIDVLNPEYEMCTFLIVHPYLDDVDHFFNQTKPIITIKDGLNQNDIKKAEKTIELLKYESTEVTTRRAEYIMAKMYAEQNKTSITEVAIENSVCYAPYH